MVDTVQSGEKMLFRCRQCQLILCRVLSSSFRKIASNLKWTWGLTLRILISSSHCCVPLSDSLNLYGFWTTPGIEGFWIWYYDPTRISVKSDPKHKHSTSSPDSPYYFDRHSPYPHFMHVLCSHGQHLLPITSITISINLLPNTTQSLCSSSEHLLMDKVRKWSC